MKLQSLATSRCVGRSRSGTNNRAFDVERCREIRERNAAMVGRLDGFVERPPPVSATPSVLGETAGGANGANVARKIVNEGQADEFHVREARVVDAAMLSHVRLGLQFLWDSYVCAHQASADPWEFSVEWLELRRLGVTCNDVRWLIRQGLVQHAYEVTGSKDDHRRFVPCPSLNLSKRTCLIMTEEGCRLSQQFAEAHGTERTAAAHGPVTVSFVSAAPANGNGNGNGKGNGVVELLVPKWDRDRRQLRLDARVIKEFKVPAPNQEIILGAFEEEHWPPKIDDPLPPKSGIVPQRRLHDTINSLNRRQRHRLLHFTADGLGRGVRWELLRKHNSRD
jgi:hypothetical protein